MRRRTLLAAFLVLGLAACFSSLPDKKYFQIPLDASPPGAGPFAASLLVDHCDIGALYDDFRIVYRLSPYEINYYSYEFWAEKPSKLIRDSIIRYLEGAGLFAKLYVEPTKESVDWTLRLAVRRVEEVDAPEAWSARLDMKLEIVDARTGASLAERTFDRQEPLPRKSVREMPTALSRILGEEFRALLRKVPRT